MRSIAITNCYRTKVGCAFYLATQKPTPRVTEKPSQQPIQNCLATSLYYSIKSYVLEVLVSNNLCSRTCNMKDPVYRSVSGNLLKHNQHKMPGHWIHNPMMVKPNETT